MFIDSISAEMNSETDSDNAAYVENFSTRQQISEYVPDWKIAFRPDAEEEAETTAPEIFKPNSGFCGNPEMNAFENC